MLLTAANRPSTVAKCTEGSRRARKLQSVKMHQLILMRFNSSARDAKLENVLIVSPKTVALAATTTEPLFLHIWPMPPGQELSRTERRNVGAPLHFDDACVASLSFSYLSLSLSASFTVAVCWAGRAIVKFNQGNLYASIAYRDKLT